MNTNRSKRLPLRRQHPWYPAVLLFLVAELFFGSSCGKKTIPLPTPKTETTTGAIEPEITLQIVPSTVKAGERAVLNWKVTNADTVVIDGGIGTVGLEGSRVLLPKSSAIYTLTAQGYGKTKTAKAEITVQGKLAPPITEPPPSNETFGNVSIEELFTAKVKDIFFEYDRFELSQEAVEILYVNASFFREHPDLNFTLSGHCDERGTVEYNLALGERRAKGVKDFLVNIGIDPKRITSISYGEEKPFITGSTEDSFVQNRRVHFQLNLR